MTANELIERYVQEVGSYLPRKGREDIQRELTSLLLDAVEERGDGREATAQTAAKVLLEFGPPKEMAAQYHGGRYLIGPQLYDTYHTVAAVTLMVISVLYLLVLGLMLWRGEAADLPQAALGWLMDFGQTVIVNLGILTLVFAAIERYYGRSLGQVAAESAWDPLTLPPVNDPNRIKVGELVAGIAAEAIFLGIFVALINPDGRLGWLVVNSFRPLLGLLIASTCVDIALRGIVLWQGRWNGITRLAEIGAETFSVFIVYRIVTGGPISVYAGLTWGIKAVLGVVLVIAVINLGLLLYRLVARWRTTAGIDFRPLASL